MKPTEEKQSSSKPIPIKNTLKPKEESSDDEYKTPNAPNFLNDKNVRFSLDNLLDPNKNEYVEEPENLDNIVLTREDIFVNLTLISKIEVGDKLIRNKDDKHLNIDTSYFQFITRWLKGNSRNTSLKFISLVLSKAFEINDTLLADKTHVSAQQLFRLTSDLKNCLNGLNNLKQTYTYDKLIQSEIDVMIDNVRSKLDLNSKSLHF
jgi:hypothetical protein